MDNLECCIENLEYFTPHEQHELLENMGYNPVAHVLHASSVSRERCISLHENAERLLSSGAVIGPCFLEGVLYSNGIAFYLHERTEN